MRSVKVARTSIRNAQFLPKRRTRSSCQTGAGLQHTRDGRPMHPDRHKYGEAKASALVLDIHLRSAPGPGADAENAPESHLRHQYRAATLVSRHGRAQAMRASDRQCSWLDGAAQRCRENTNWLHGNDATTLISWAALKMCANFCAHEHA